MAFTTVQNAKHEEITDLIRRTVGFDILQFPLRHQQMALPALRRIA